MSDSTLTAISSALIAATLGVPAFAVDHGNAVSAIAIELQAYGTQPDDLESRLPKAGLSGA